MRKKVLKWDDGCSEYCNVVTQKLHYRCWLQIFPCKLVGTQKPNSQRNMGLGTLGHQLPHWKWTFERLETGENSPILRIFLSNNLQWLNVFYRKLMRRTIVWRLRWVLVGLQAWFGERETYRERDTHIRKQRQRQSQRDWLRDTAEIRTENQRYRKLHR